MSTLTTLTGSPSSALPTPTTFNTIVTSLTESIGPSSTQISPSDLPTNPNSQPRNNNTSPTQNYLFFIALALGIVFVNLWIILGVRFLYRRRRRQQALADPENHPDPMIPMIARGMAMSAGTGRSRQRRRKREKKVVSLAFLDDNFPVTRYADWKNGTYTSEKTVTEKVLEKEITEKNVAGQEMDSFSDEHHLDDANQTTIIVEGDLGIGFASLSNSEGASALSLTETNSRSDRVEPPSDPDTCAICIEQLEDCDEIRVLKCNHVFHFSCITPWMTNRNASCPLCKTLYYIPPAPPMPDWLANNGPAPPPTVDTGVMTAGSDDSPSPTNVPHLAAGLPPAAPAPVATSRLSRFKRAMRLT